MLASIFHVEPLMITELWLHPSYHKAHFLHAPLHMWCRYSKHTHILLVCLFVCLSPVPTQIPTCNVQLQFGIRGSMLVQGTNYKLWNWNFYLWTDWRGALIDTIWLHSCSVVKEGRGATRVSCRNCGSCINEYWMSERCL
jgi:hypothetical protein